MVLSMHLQLHAAWQLLSRGLIFNVTLPCGFWFDCNNQYINIYHSRATPSGGIKYASSHFGFPSKDCKIIKEVHCLSLYRVITELECIGGGL